MNIKEYISSGILELYVLGRLSEVENMEVSDLAKVHPEINEEILDIEISLFQLSEELASNKLPVKERILGISKEQSNTAHNIDNKGPKIVPIQPWWKQVAVVACLLLLSSILGNLYYYTQLQDKSAKLQALLDEQSVLAENATIYQTNYKNTNEQFQAIRAPGTKVVELQGQAVAPDAKAVVYWNPDKQTVFLDANQLPTPPKGKVYQLWTLKLKPLTPTDAGVMSEFKTDGDNFFQLKNVSSSEAFAITLEPVGGSVSPTLEQLYVMGTL